MGGTVINGLLVTLVGMLVVFFALVCLIGATVLMSKVMKNFKDKAPEAAPAKKAPAPKAADAAINGSTLAAIGAAVATVMDTDPDGIKIVSLKKLG